MSLHSAVAWSDSALDHQNGYTETRERSWMHVKLMMLLLWRCHRHKRRQTRTSLLCSLSISNWFADHLGHSKFHLYPTCAIDKSAATHMPHDCRTGTRHVDKPKRDNKSAIAGVSVGGWLTVRPNDDNLIKWSNWEDERILVQAGELDSANQIGNYLWCPTSLMLFDVPSPLGTLFSFLFPCSQENAASDCNN